MNGDTPRDCPPAADSFPCMTAARSAFWTIPANALFPFVPRVGQYASGASEARFAREQYERYFFPLMRPGQKAWVVPGVYGKDSGGNRTAAAATEDELLAKLDGYLQWASGPDGGRIAGINPWHWPALPGIKPASMELGAASFPRLLAKIARVVAALPPV